jgi:transcription elongation factor Elf1
LRPQRSAKIRSGSKIAKTKSLNLKIYFFMIICPNCSHSNPEGAVNCEACYTSLPATKACPSCGVSVQLDATFCGQCGHSFNVAVNPPAPEVATVVALPATVLTSNEPIPTPIVNPPAAIETPAITPPPVMPVVEVSTPTIVPVVEAVAVVAAPATQIQQAAYQLFHLQTNKDIELPPHLQVVLIGKPNEQSPPDIDVSGFPCSEVVSRVHANIRIEGSNYYLEDLGSANGTYVNHNALVKGNRHLLRTGDRIGLGKGDLVTFLFQNSRS